MGNCPVGKLVWWENGLVGKWLVEQMSWWKNGLVGKCPGGKTAEWDNGRWENGLVGKLHWENGADSTVSSCFKIHNMVEKYLNGKILTLEIDSSCVNVN